MPERNASGDDLLTSVTAYLMEQVRPRAEALDVEPAALREVLEAFCDRGWMAMRRPMAYGGPELDEASFRGFQEATARASGAFAFLQTQHQSAVAMLARGSNEALKAEYLPLMADGRRLVGIGFSQLRRPGPPMLAATEVAGGYRLDGEVPWVTGLGFYPEFLVGAALPDGTAVFGLVPFGDADQGPGRIRVGEPMALAAMGSAMTVSARLEGWSLPADRVAFVRPPGWIHRNDLVNIALQGFFAIGCAEAGLDVAEAAGRKRGTEATGRAVASLRAEIAACRSALAEAQARGEETTSERLRLRAWAIELAVRCAHAGVAATGGSANAVGHPAQRVFREALVYTVSAQTTPIMEATLERLSRRSEPLSEEV
ncbi:MAG: acyl-CoA/acyl-ACP dehydrogenase [Fimbriimonadaceae bacterium]|nr:acyl-CoA/acyl-ACP dehydrogenase [Fimbriimonadaceae bacterium]